MSKRAEAELYLPVKQYFEAMGFEVKAEIHGCDLVAIRGKELIIVELKTSFNLTLLLQGIDRQKKTDDVFLAIEMPKNLRRYSHWRDIQGLCRRLGLGLLTVRFSSGEPHVEEICLPGPYRPQMAKRRQTMILREFSSRSGDYNTGGVNKRPLMTAYRENALRIADFLLINGPSSVKTMREHLKMEKIGPILQKNFYRWYTRTGRGIYTLTPNGEEALQTYRTIIETFSKEQVSN